MHIRTRLSNVRGSGLLLAAPLIVGLLVTAGCQSSRRDGEGGLLRAGLPPSAERVAEGGRQLTFTPEEHGQVYIYDLNQDRVVGRYALRRGQRLAVDAAAGRATLDGNEVAVGDVRSGGSFEIYFLAGAEQ